MVNAGSGKGGVFSSFEYMSAQVSEQQLCASLRLLAESLSHAIACTSSHVFVAVACKLLRQSDTLI